MPQKRSESGAKETKIVRTRECIDYRAERAVDNHSHPPLYKSLTISEKKTRGVDFLSCL